MALNRVTVPCSHKMQSATLDSAAVAALPSRDETKRQALIASKRHSKAYEGPLSGPLGGKAVWLYRVLESVDFVV
jgi:hypothetical protein